MGNVFGCITHVHENHSVVDPVLTVHVSTISHLTIADINKLNYCVNDWFNDMVLYTNDDLVYNDPI
jgi:hypothetical protein